MTDTNNIPDTFGGGAHKRRDERLPAHLLPKAVPVPTFSDGYGDPGDPNVLADSDRIVSGLKSVMQREVSTINKPTPNSATGTVSRTPLMEIAERIKKLVHDHGEQFGDELKAKMEQNTSDKMSVAKALQKWADDTLTDKDAKEKESQRGT